MTIRPPSNIIPHASLQSLNTLGVSACATYLIEVDSLEHLSDVLLWRKRQQPSLSIMVLGGGSNIILGGDINGLVIHVKILGREIIAEDDDHVWLRVGAGESWHDLVSFCVDFHYWGLENLALIPGSVGAAPVQNIGAYGVEMCEHFVELSALEINSGVSMTFDRDACAFGYRDSIFKQCLQDCYIITSVVFKLAKQPCHRLQYPALKSFFEKYKPEAVSPRQVFEAVCEIRRSKLPDPQDVPNVGSFFKNPLVDAERFSQLQQQYPAIVGFTLAQDQVKLAAGWLIDHAGWRGYRDGAVGVHEQQALVITNAGHGDGGEVLALASRIRDDIELKFGVLLEIEPRVYGI